MIPRRGSATQSTDRNSRCDHGAWQVKIDRARHGRQRSEPRNPCWRPPRAGTVSLCAEPAFGEQPASTAGGACHGSEQLARTRIASTRRTVLARPECAGGLPWHPAELNRGTPGSPARPWSPLPGNDASSWALARVGRGVLDSAARADPQIAQRTDTVRRAGACRRPNASEGSPARLAAGGGPRVDSLAQRPGFRDARACSHGSRRSPRLAPGRSGRRATRNSPVAYRSRRWRRRPRCSPRWGSSDSSRADWRRSRHRPRCGWCRSERRDGTRPPRWPAVTMRPCTARWRGSPRHPASCPWAVPAHPAARWDMSGLSGGV